MPHRCSAAVACSVAALLVAAAGASSASAASVSPKVTLATPNQAALLATHAAVVTLAAPANSVATVALYADGHRVSAKRRLVAHRARHLRQVLTLTSDGLVAAAPVRDPEARSAHGRPARVADQTVRTRRTLTLDVKRCPAPAHRPRSQPVPPAPTPVPPAPTPYAEDRSRAVPGGHVSRRHLARQADGRRRLRSGLHRDRRRARPAPGEGVLRRPRQAGRDVRVGRRAGLVRRVPGAEHRRRRRRRAPRSGRGAHPARLRRVRRERRGVRDARPRRADDPGDLGPHRPRVSAPGQGGGRASRRSAEADAHDAELWSATGTIHGLLSQVQGTDQMAGFAVDDSLPILWARKPGTGATLGLYANVPVHADQYNSTAAGNNQFTADYPGYVRDQLAKTLGGTAVIAMGTLGRQEGIGASPDYAEVSEQGRFVTNALMRGLTHARRITDTTLAQPRSRSRPRPRTPGCSRRCRATTSAARSAARARSPSPPRTTWPARGTGGPSARSSRSTARCRLRTSRPPPPGSGRRRPSPASAIRCTPLPRVRRSPRSPTRSCVRSPPPTASATCTSSITPATSSATTGTHAPACTRRPARPERLRQVQRRVAARTGQRRRGPRRRRRPRARSDRAERVRRDRQPECVLGADDPVLPRPGGNRRSRSELLRDRPRRRRPQARPRRRSDRRRPRRTTAWSRGTSTTARSRRTRTRPASRTRSRDRAPTACRQASPTTSATPIAGRSRCGSTRRCPRPSTSPPTTASTS